MAPRKPYSNTTKGGGKSKKTTKPAIEATQGPSTNPTNPISTLDNQPNTVKSPPEQDLNSDDEYLNREAQTIFVIESQIQTLHIFKDLFKILPGILLTKELN
jgi:hypothetical protein